MHADPRSRNYITGEFQLKLKNNTNLRRIAKLEELNPTHYKALTMLACGHSNEYVAAQIGVSIRSIQNWRKRPDFHHLLKVATAKMFDAAIAELVLGSVEAARELRRLIADSDVPARVRVTAISILLTHGARAKDALLEQRLEKVERLLDGADPSEDSAD